MKRSFLFAFRGILACMRAERNFRIHLAASFYVLLASAVARLSAVEWALVLLCIGAVTGAELFNTALEKLCDTLHPARNTGIGMAKDFAAAAVLMTAAASAVVGGIIFFNNEKLTRAVSFVKDHTVLSILIVISLPVAAFLVFRRYGNDKKNSHDHNSGTSERR
jgi:diacylglycerol kinase